MKSSTKNIISPGTLKILVQFFVDIKCAIDVIFFSKIIMVDSFYQELKDDNFIFNSNWLHGPTMLDSPLWMSHRGRA